MTFAMAINALYPRVQPSAVAVLAWYGYFFVLRRMPSVSGGLPPSRCASANGTHNSPPSRQQTYAFATTAAGTVTTFGLVSRTEITQAPQSVEK